MVSIKYLEVDQGERAQLRDYEDQSVMVVDGRA